MIKGVVAPDYLYKKGLKQLLVEKSCSGSVLSTHWHYICMNHS